MSGRERPSCRPDCCAFPRLLERARISARFNWYAWLGACVSCSTDSDRPGPSADAGDSLNTQVKTCFAGWGNSYLIEWANPAFRVQQVTGDSNGKGTPQGNSIRESEIARSPVNKIILGDWPWHANRDTKAKQTVWHNYKGKRYENMLFGDAHVENFKFPPQMDQWQSSPAPDPNFTWW